MAGQIRLFPPNRRALLRYHRATLEDNAAWFDAYVLALQTARPDMNIELIPVARRLAELLSNAPFDDVPAKTLYLDDAPQGTATLYFLASLVTFDALFGRAPPSEFDPGPGVAAIFRDQLTEVMARVLNRPDLALAAPPPRETPKQPEPSVPVQKTDGQSAAPAPPPATGDDDPVDIRPAMAPRPIPGGPPGQGEDNGQVAVGLNGISDWSTQVPFLDLMKSARPWTGHLPGQWGGVSFDELQAGGHLDANGWPVRVPDGVEKLETYLLTDQPEAARSLRGDYVLTYKGQGRVKVAGRARRVRREEGRITFSYSPGDGPIAVGILETDPAGQGDYIRDIVIIRKDRLDLADAGEVFNPDWLARIQNLGLVRFMDWMSTNGATAQQWTDRPTTRDFSYAWRGVPAEVMIDLANRIGADAWFTLPNAGDDMYFAEFAMAVRDRMDPRLTAYVEFSNEIWNFIFPQAHWAREMADARWGADAAEDAWLQFAGLRAAQMADIWARAFGRAQRHRFRVVAATHTGWPGLETALLKAPLYVAENAANTAPSTRFDAYAVTGYFGYELGQGAGLALVQGQIEASRRAAEDRGAANGLKRVALREFVRAHQYDDALGPVLDMLRSGSLRELTDTVWPYHAGVAAAYGLELIMYEGGTHATASGEAVNDDQLTGFFARLNHSKAMGDLYALALARWSALGGRWFNAFVDVAAPTKWGSWGNLRHLDDESPRWDALTGFNALGPASSLARLDGVRLQGTDGPDKLDGTVEEDVILAGGGDDLIRPYARADRIHGGPGTDRVILSGAATDYHWSEVGTQVHVAGTGGTKIITSVEEVTFTGAPGRVFQIRDVLNTEP